MGGCGLGWNRGKDEMGGRATKWAVGPKGAVPNCAAVVATAAACGTETAPNEILAGWCERGCETTPPPPPPPPSTTAVQPPSAGAVNETPWASDGTGLCWCWYWLCKASCCGGGGGGGARTARARC